LHENANYLGCLLARSDFGAAAKMEALYLSTLLPNPQQHRFPVALPSLEEDALGHLPAFTRKVVDCNFHQITASILG